MTATVSPASNVGIISIAITLYCILLCGIQFFMKHEASKLLISLSSGSLLLMSCSSAFISLTYYSPTLWSSDTSCYCHPLWSASLISYISSIYLLKAVYVTRVHLLSQGSVLGTPQTKKGIKITIISLALSSVCCFALMIFMTDGECHSDPNIKGCIATFHLADIYIAMAMILFDAVLFAGFCYKWYKIMFIFKMSEADHKIPTKVIQTFIIQFFLTITAMTSCFFDGVLHLMIHNEGYNYHITMIIFLFDCTVVATCNFCMISESQMIIKKLLCFCCPSQPNRPIIRRTPSLGYPSGKSNSMAPPRTTKTLTNTRSNTVMSMSAVSVTQHHHDQLQSPSMRPSLVLANTLSNQSQIPMNNPGFSNNISDFDASRKVEGASNSADMVMPPLSIQPTNSGPVHDRKLSVDEIREIRAEIAECVRRGSVVIVYKGGKGKGKGTKADNSTPDSPDTMEKVEEPKDTEETEETGGSSPDIIMKVDEENGETFL